MKDLEEVRGHIRALAARLDPASRYVTDLLSIADAANDIGDFGRRLDAGCRGLRHAGADVFSKMTLEEKILSNLITPETTLFRFSEGELEAIDRHLLPHLESREAKILVVPCSHGEEAFTIAAYFLKVGVRFSIRAFDLQPALIEEARSGRLTFGYPIEFLAAPGFVAERVLDRITFDVGDAFDLPIQGERFDLILCRNFLGYFVEESAVAVVDGLQRRLADGGVLFLDGFCLSRLPGIERVLDDHGFSRLFGRPAFTRK